MNPTIRRRALRDGIWFAGTLVALALLIGGSSWRLAARRAAVEDLEREIQERRATLAQALPGGARTRTPEQAQDTLERWRALVRDESERIAELSRAAREAGVTIVSLRSGGDGGEDALVSCSHLVRCTGGYRQLARFLDAVYASSGVAGVDELEIRPDAEAPAGPLLAFLRVTWYAPAPGAEDEVDA